jgi:hypothetical protein
MNKEIRRGQKEALLNSTTTGYIFSAIAKEPYLHRMKYYVPVMLLLIASCSSKQDGKNVVTNSPTESASDSVTFAESIVVIEHSVLPTAEMVYGDNPPDSIYEYLPVAERYGNTQGSCEDGVLIQVRYVTVDGETKLDLIWSSSKDGELSFSPAITFDNTDYQGTSSVDLTTSYPLSDDCATLAVTEDYEGGDIDLTRRRATTFFAISEGNITEILSVTEENTRITDYFVSGNENQTGARELAEIIVMEESLNGYKDVKVVYTSVDNADTLSHTETVYQFQDGQYKKTD